MSKYEGARVAVDAAIFSIQDQVLTVLVHRREKAPFLDSLELPGGLLAPRETAEEALQRKLKTLVPTAERWFCEQFHTFTDPDRDPRERTVSISHIALVPPVPPHEGAEWKPYDAIKKMAFDHLEILRVARAHLRVHATLPLMRHLLPDVFRLNELQKLFELLTERVMDNRNFRRWALGTGFVEETKQVLKNVSHRPAQLFRLRDASP